MHTWECVLSLIKCALFTLCYFLSIFTELQEELQWNTMYHTRGSCFHSVSCSCCGFSLHSIIIVTIKQDSRSQCLYLQNIAVSCGNTGVRVNVITMWQCLKARVRTVIVASLRYTLITLNTLTIIQSISTYIAPNHNKCHLKALYIDLYNIDYCCRIKGYFCLTSP